MVKRLMGTSKDVSLTTLRVVLGVVFFAHGAQRMLGWFGGEGFHVSMGGYAHMGIPAPAAFLIICAQFFGGLGSLLDSSLALLLSEFAGLMIGAIFMVHLQNGFFMNWMGTQKGEGVEYHLLALAMAAALLLRGGGGFSLDRALRSRVQSWRVHWRWRRAPFGSAGEGTCPRELGT